VNTNIFMKRFAAILGSALIGLMLATGANAANPETVPVDVTFVAPITITAVSSLKFGLLDVGMAATNTITIAAGGGVSDPQGNIVGGTQAAASMTITSIGSTGITITADSPIDGAYWTLGAFNCDYDGAGSDTACGSGYDVTSPAGGIATLLVGATLTAIGGAVAAPDNGSFDVTVVYQ
jgi:hypothetical protein